MDWQGGGEVDFKPNNRKGETIMKLERLNRIFDENCELTEEMSRIVEHDNERGREMRGTVDWFIQKHMAVNPVEALELESAINGLVVLTGSAYEALGVILGQRFDIIDPDALQEIDELSREIKEGGSLRFWAKNGTDCHS